jgi:hypothetical protein
VCVHRPDLLLTDNVLSRRGTDHLGEPAPVGWTPMCPARSAASVSEPTSVEAELGGREITHRLFARPREVTDGVVFHRRDVDGGAIACAPQAGQWPRVPAVGFDAVARLVGNP